LKDAFDTYFDVVVYTKRLELKQHISKSSTRKKNLPRVMRRVSRCMVLSTSFITTSTYGCVLARCVCKVYMNDRWSKINFEILRNAGDDPALLCSVVFQSIDKRIHTRIDLLIIQFVAGRTERTYECNARSS
jgi:hypothetical protein